MITKVKLEAGRTKVFYTDESNAGRIQKETVYSCSEDKHPDFQKALTDLAPLAISLLGLPVEYVNGVTVSGVSISENEHQGMGAVITLLKEIPGINSPFVMNTPHVHNAEEGGSIMPTALRNQIKTLVDEAQAFVNGKRAQGNLLDEQQAA